MTDLTKKLEGILRIIFELTMITRREIEHTNDAIPFRD
jgi:hypothetical protein